MAEIITVLNAGLTLLTAVLLSRILVQTYKGEKHPNAYLDAVICFKSNDGSYVPKEGDLLLIKKQWSDTLWLGKVTGPAEGDVVDITIVGEDTPDPWPLHSIKAVAIRCEQDLSSNPFTDAETHTLTTK